MNLGDLIEHRGNIHGDGVKLAARVEALAEPGGICIPEPVHTAMQGTLSLDCEYVGPQRVKNIIGPVKALLSAGA